MPHRTDWLIKNYVVQSKCEGNITLEEVIELKTDIRDNYFENSDHPIHVLYKLEGKVTFPNNLRKINTVTKIISEHRNMGWLIVVGLNNPIVSFFSSTVGQMVKMKIKEVKTVDEALEVLYRVDNNIPRINV